MGPLPWATLSQDVVLQNSEQLCLGVEEIAFPKPLPS